MGRSAAASAIIHSPPAGDRARSGALRRCACAVARTRERLLTLIRGVALSDQSGGYIAHDCTFSPSSSSHRVCMDGGD